MANEITIKLAKANKWGRGEAGVDKDIAPLCQALNDAGIETVASCSGHGYRPGSVALRDGRWIVVAKDHDEWKRIEALFPVDIHGESTK